MTLPGKPRTRETTHPCPRHGCERRVPRNQLACPSHWSAVTVGTQRAVYAAYRTGRGHAEALQRAIAEMNGEAGAG